MNELSDSPHSLHLSAGISGERASDDPSRVAGGQLLRSDLLAVHATLAISRCAGRGRAAIVKMERGARRRPTDRRGKLDTVCLPQRPHLRMLTVKSNNNQSRREMDRLDDHYQRIGTSERGWRDIQLAKFESKILQSNREREFPARARV